MAANDMVTQPDGAFETMIKRHIPAPGLNSLWYRVFQRHMSWFRFDKTFSGIFRQYKAFNFK